MSHTVARQRWADRLRNHEKIERGLAGGDGEPARSKGKVRPLIGADINYADRAPGLPSSTMNDAVVAMGASGEITVSRPRSSVNHWVEVTSHRV